MSTGRQRANTEETDFTEKMFREQLRRYRLQQQPDSDILYVHICDVRFTNENYVTIQQPPVCQSPQALLYASPTSYHPGAARRYAPAPTALRLAADLRPSVDGSAVRTRLSYRQPACL